MAQPNARDMCTKLIWFRVYKPNFHLLNYITHIPFRRSYSNHSSKRETVKFLLLPPLYVLKVVTTVTAALSVILS
jgi:hypothetical protein